jgi:cytoskeletal protein CcmA (bactofilin family)
MILASVSQTDKSKTDWTGFLGPGVKIEGTVEVEGIFRVDGPLKGKIISHSTLFLGEGSEVEGQVEAERVVVAGRFEGVIFARERVEIHAKGLVKGEIHAPCLVIEPGGVLDGHCHILNPNEEALPVAIAVRAAASR